MSERLVSCLKKNPNPNQQPPPTLQPTNKSKKHHTPPPTSPQPQNKNHTNTQGLGDLDCLKKNLSTLSARAGELITNLHCSITLTGLLIQILDLPVLALLPFPKKRSVYLTCPFIKRASPSWCLSESLGSHSLQHCSCVTCPTVSVILRMLQFCVCVQAPAPACFLGHMPLCTAA